MRDKKGDREYDRRETHRPKGKIRIHIRQLFREKLPGNDSATRCKMQDLDINWFKIFTNNALFY